MKGRIAIITGATGGVGQTVTEHWLEAGAQVVAIGGSEASLAALGTHDRLATLALDLTKPTAGAEMIAFAESRFGAPDTLVHLVGGFAMGPLGDGTGLDRWNRMMAMNATTALIALEALTPVFRAKGRGWVVGLTSRAVLAPGAQLAAYAASKAALGALFASAAEELRPDKIHVNLISTSTVDTPANRAAMGDANAEKWVRPADIAAATLYLCSEAASAVYGATLEVYGRA